jgi:hypothetical protein
MKTLSAIYFVLSLFALFCIEDAQISVILTIWANAFVSYFVARKFNPQIFYK